VVEVNQNLTLCHLGNIVHGLTGIVPNTGILIREAGEYRRYNNFKVPSELLQNGKHEA
jgi:hypothetical protein